MMPEHCFIWPEARFLSRGFRGASPVSPARVESFLSEMFGNRGVPVVVSSGRVGLVLALEQLGIRRVDPVGLFPYASHCVIESVGRVGSPVCDSSAATMPRRVIYHQWGYVQEHARGGHIVEDAVDSFCLPSAMLFPAGGDFEVWSLSKLLGSLGGGVLWCRDEAAAATIRARRDGRNSLTTLRWLLRLLSRPCPCLVPFWYGAESLGGAPPGWACGDILSGLREWESIIEARRRRLAMFLDVLPPWLPRDDSRLPTAVPVIASESQGQALVALGFSAGFRHFERVAQTGDRTLLRVFPIPVHQDVPLRLLDAARRIMLNAN